MIRNYLLLFARNLLRQKLFSSINLLGLTVSLASTLLIALYVGHELSYDSFHPNADRLYRVNQTFIWGEDNHSQFSRTGPGVAHALKAEFPEIEATTSLHTPGSFIVSYAGANEVISFEETEVLSADTNFFRVLGFPLIQGTTSGAFGNENTLMLTRSTARKYFGNADPIGKFLRLGLPNDSTTQNYEVIGVLEDVPANSTIKFDVLLSSKNFMVERLHWSWIWTQLETFVLLRENADVSNVRARLSSVPEKHAEETLQRIMNISYKEYIASGKRWDLFLQPISTLHLPEYPVVGSFSDVADRKTILALAGAAVFIIILSCINFANLSTAQFARRVKESAIRKILGLRATNIAFAYFVEALIFCVLALVIALALTQMVLPAFQLLTAKPLTLSSLLQPIGLLGLATLILAMAAISSAYPAFFLSRFRPVDAVKGKIRGGRRGAGFGNALVVFQFAVSVVLIICTGVVFQQLSYVAEKDLGFEKENLIQIKHAEGIGNPDMLISSLKTIPGVLAASHCTSMPPEIFGGDKFSADGLNGENFSLSFTTADEHFIPSLGIDMKVGRNFSENSPSDVNAVILNETALRRIGWPADETVIGKRIFYPNEQNISFEVIGVAKDFNYWSLEVDIEPMAIFHIDNEHVFGGHRRNIALRIEPQTIESWTTTSGLVEQVWRRHAGATPFEYGFIDAYFADTFKTQARFGSVLVIVAVLAMMIACLGLLGVIIYAMEQRTKEIGIRKISGATSGSILTLVVKSYMRLILFAFVIGAPLAYFLMKDWLAGFSYRIEPSPLIFIGTAVGVLVAATAITGYHALRVSQRNPVDVLRDE